MITVLELPFHFNKEDYLMKKGLFLKLSLLFIAVLCLQNGFAQDYTRWGLPDGAKARLGKGWILDFAYSPDGTRLAVGTSIGIWLYDADTGAELSLLTGHTDWVWSVAFSLDGNTLASGSLDNTIRLWDAHTGEYQHTLEGEGHTSSVWSVAFSPDGKTLASGSTDDTIRLWDAHTGEIQQILDGHKNSVWSVAFSPDGGTLASGSGDKTIRLWNAHTGESQRTLWGHTRWIESVTFSPDGATLASGSSDRTIRLWDAHTGELQQTLEGHKNSVWSVAFSRSLTGTILPPPSISPRMGIHLPAEEVGTRRFNCGMLAPGKFSRP
jgi:WD40 repeat protein